MKIEKINEMQIRCTLYREDLEKRHMKLSELAYGTENARVLFSEMMKFAYTKYGFEANDMPLMIEAVPISDDSVVLNITKIEYPEELDTRFSRFSEYEDDDIPFYEDIYDQDSLEYMDVASANDIIDTAKDTPTGEIKEITRIFSFKRMDDMISFSKALFGNFKGLSTLYKGNGNSPYYLVMKNGSESPAGFNKVCNIATEYGSLVSQEAVDPVYFNEHYKLIIEDDAVKTLYDL